MNSYINYLIYDQFYQAVLEPEISRGRNYVRLNEDKLRAPELVQKKKKTRKNSKKEGRNFSEGSIKRRKSLITKISPMNGSSANLI